MINKIISGGQTGADRGGLDAGISLDIPIGGWAPKDFKAEDGKVPEFYRLKEHMGGYLARTEQNIIDSSATAIFYYEKMSGGTSTTRRLCISNSKPWIGIDCLKPDQYNMERLICWILKIGPKVLNVAGPRASKGEKWNRSISNDTKRLLMASVNQMR